MTTLHEAAQKALEALELAVRQNSHDMLMTGEEIRKGESAIEALREALAQPDLTTCNCRWDGETQVQQCTLHEAHVDAIHEWAERAKTAEAALAQQGEQQPDGLPLVISGAIFDFAGYLTTRPKVIEVGSGANALPMVELIKEWADLRGLSLDDSAIQSWQEWLPTGAAPAPQAQQSDDYMRGFHDGMKEAPTGECWIRVIDEAMVGAHLGVADMADDYGTAKKKLNDLICWSVEIDRESARHAPAAQPTCKQDLQVETEQERYVRMCPDIECGRKKRCTRMVGVSCMSRADIAATPAGNSNWKPLPKISKMILQPLLSCWRLIAKKYGVGIDTVSLIRAGKIWRNV